MTAARKLNVTPPDGLLHGDVVLCQGRTFSVATATHGELMAERAASCLLAPRPRDTVLLSLTPRPFIIAVLLRDEEEPARLVFEGDARIEAPAGRLDMVAAEGISATTPRRLSLLAERLTLQGKTGELLVEQAELIAVKARAQLKKLALVADSYDAFVERIATRSKRVFRFVEEYDQLRARHFDYRAEQSAQITANNTAITARQVARVDGEQVHIG